jgi:P pilus assembly chaperone PapD
MRFFRKPAESQRQWWGSCCLKTALVLGLILLWAGLAQAGFSVEMTPARLELKANPGKTLRAAIKLRTRGRGAQKVEVTKGHFGLDDEGAPLFDTPQDGPQSAAAWVTINQTSFTINPNQERLLRLEVTVPPQTPSGGYRAALYVTPPPGDAKSKEGGATVFLQGRLALLIYVTVGAAKPDGQVKAWEWRQISPGKEASLAFQVNNQGNAHLRLAGVAQIVDAQGQKYDAIVPGLPVLPGQSQWVPLDFPEKTPPVGSAVTIEAAIDLGQGEKRIHAQVGGRK